MQSGRKLPESIDNPIDNLLLRGCEKLVQPLHTRRITPNQVTIFRIFLGLLVLGVLFYSRTVVLPVIGILIFYTLDCLDGHLARSTDQVTELGDHLDHIADVTFFSVVLYYIYTSDFPNKKLIGGLLIVVLYLSCVHMGIQQQVYNSGKDQSTDRAKVEQTELLNRLNLIHPFKAHDIRWSRYFGMGTMAAVVASIVLYIRINDRSQLSD